MDHDDFDVDEFEEFGDFDSPMMEALAELRDGYWKQKDGKLIHVSDMNYTHLKNSHGLLVRKMMAETNQAKQELWLAWLDLLSAEMKKR